MGRPCSICTSKKLLLINRARFVEKLSYGDIAARFRLADGTVKRHFRHTAEPTEPTALGGLPVGELNAVAPPPRLPAASVGCVVCPSRFRQDIERGLVANIPFAELEHRYRVTEEGITRHATECIPELLERAKVLSTAKTATEGIAELFAEVRELLNEAKAVREYGAWASALGRLERALNLLAKLTGETRVTDEDLIMRSPVWAALMAALMRALRSYPEAAAACDREFSAVFGAPSVSSSPTAPMVH